MMPASFFRELAHLDLDPWYDQMVDKINVGTIPNEIQFPLGHPLPGQMYRQHPFNPKRHCYYPVESYFSILFEEREQELIRLLGDLGAAKIVIEPVVNAFTSIEQERKVLEYGYPTPQPPRPFDPQSYPWLTYEAGWQSVVYERLNRRMTSTQFVLDVDVIGLLRSQIQVISQLSTELDSMMFPANWEDKLLKQVLKA